MAPKVIQRKEPAGAALEKVLEAIRNPKPVVHIPIPPSDPAALAAEENSFVFASFTTEDAYELGNFLYARLLAHAAEQPALISIALANSQQVLFQTVTGKGTRPDNELWVQRKRNTVLRFGTSSYHMGRLFNGDEVVFAKKCAISDEKRASYAIHGGAYPIRVQGVEGVVAVVVVSGLRQEEDHGVILDVIRTHWE